MHQKDQKASIASAEAALNGFDRFVNIIKNNPLSTVCGVFLIVIGFLLNDSFQDKKTIRAQGIEIKALSHSVLDKADEIIAITNRLGEITINAQNGAIRRRLHDDLMTAQNSMLLKENIDFNIRHRRDSAEIEHYKSLLRH